MIVGDDGRGQLVDARLQVISQRWNAFGTKLFVRRESDSCLTQPKRQTRSYRATVKAARTGTFSMKSASIRLRITSCVPRVSS